MIKLFIFVVDVEVYITPEEDLPKFTKKQGIQLSK